VQDGDRGCLLLFASEDTSLAASADQGSGSSSGNGVPGVLLLNSSAMIAGACICSSASQFKLDVLLVQYPPFGATQVQQATVAAPHSSKAAMGAAAG
jgi:hypothetical protein